MLYILILLSAGPFIFLFVYDELSIVHKLFLILGSISSLIIAIRNIKRKNKEGTNENEKGTSIALGKTKLLYVKNLNSIFLVVIYLILMLAEILELNWSIYFFLISHILLSLSFISISIRTSLQINTLIFPWSTSKASAISSVSQTYFRICFWFLTYCVLSSMDYGLFSKFNTFTPHKVKRSCSRSVMMGTWEKPAGMPGRLSI